jgi:hypothetical protein
MTSSPVCSQDRVVNVVLQKKETIAFAGKGKKMAIILPHPQWRTTSAYRTGTFYFLELPRMG